jgi:SAM-dependent methyltransferase
MKKLLHVGCGISRKENTTAAFNTAEWRETRLDIDPDVQPDVVGSMTDMSSIASGSMDAIFSSHNLEHLYCHEVPVALAEFRRVLKPDGFAVISCPDLQSVCALVAQDRLLDTAYVSAAGSIAPLDILYGHRPALAAGKLHMAHHCGFTETLLLDVLWAAGFLAVATEARAHAFDLWALASNAPLADTDLRYLAALHFPC